MTSGYTPVPLLGVDGPAEEEHDAPQRGLASRLAGCRVLPLAALLAAAIGIYHYQVTNIGNKNDAPSQPETLNEFAEVPEDLQHDGGLGHELYQESEDSTPAPPSTTLWRPTSIWGWLWVLVHRPEYFAGNPQAHKAVAKTIGRILGLPWWLIKVWFRPRGGWGRGLLGQNDDMGSVDVEFWVEPPGDDADLDALAEKETGSDLSVDTAILNEELDAEGVGADFPNSEVKGTEGRVASGGIAACSGHDFNKQQCAAVGCCTYDDKDKICHSAVGSQLCVPVTTPNPCDTTQTPGTPNPCDTTQGPAPPSPCDTTQAASPIGTTKPCDTTKPSVFRSIFR